MLSGEYYYLRQKKFDEERKKNGEDVKMDAVPQPAASFRPSQPSNRRKALI